MSSPNFTPAILKPLTPRQRVFVWEYCVDLNPVRAARAAGLNGHYAKKAAVLWLDPDGKYPQVAKAVREALEERRLKCEATSERVLKELASIAFFNVKDLVNPDGSMKDLKDMPREVAAAISSFKLSYQTRRGGRWQRSLEDGENETEEKTLDVQFWSKVTALDMLARHFGLYDKRPEEGEGDGAFDWLKALAEVHAKEDRVTKRLEEVKALPNLIQEMPGGSNGHG